jgi:hypothetical protein
MKPRELRARVCPSSSPKCNRRLLHLLDVIQAVLREGPAHSLLASCSGVSHKLHDRKHWLPMAVLHNIPDFAIRQGYFGIWPGGEVILVEEKFPVGLLVKGAE